MSESAKNPNVISGWHAHVYYDAEDAESRARAERLRHAVEARFSARMGRWHDVQVGPHPGAMYQIAFGPELFPTLVPFLMLNRDGLTILLHPETGRPRDDHTRHAAWLGAVLAIKAEALPEAEE